MYWPFRLSQNGEHFRLQGLPPLDRAIAHGATISDALTNAAAALTDELYSLAARSQVFPESPTVGGPDTHWVQANIGTAPIGVRELSDRVAEAARRTMARAGRSPGCIHHPDATSELIRVDEDLQGVLIRGVPALRCSQCHRVHEDMRLVIAVEDLAVALRADGVKELTVVPEVSSSD